MKQTTMIDMGDLLHYAVSIGFDWNQTCDLLDRDGVRPVYETKTTDLYFGVGKDYGWSEDSTRIVEGFLTKHNLTSATLIDG